jgi:fibronectin type 3 domain-containing protein
MPGKNSLNVCFKGSMQGLAGKLALFIGCWFVLGTAAHAQALVHPGCLSTQPDLDRMAAKVAANEQPWKSGFDRLVNNNYSHLGHSPNPQATVYASSSDGGDNYIHLARDVASAYQAALRYHVTGDTAYADKAVSTLMAWANTHTAWSGNTNVSLRAGLYGYQLACAGELMRNYSGWAPADFAKFQTYVRTMFYRYCSPNAVDRGFLFHHHGTCWSHYWANWELASMATVIATGVLCDDQAIFNEAIDYFYNGVGVGRISELLHYRHPDGLGQSQEFGRDQGHATMLVPLLGTFCEIAWNQGLDLYSELENASLAMCEDLAKYNLGYDVPYVTYVNCDYVIQTNIGSGQGQMRPGWDMIYNHFVNRKGMAAPYSKAAAEQIRPDGGGGDYGGNSGGFDQLGFTTLTHSLDPITEGALPSQLRPHVKGSTVTLSWRGSAYARSYNVKRATASGGPYINLAEVEARNTCYVDPGLPPGTTCYYVVSANNPDGESANSAETSATPDGQLYGTVIGTTGSYGDKGARREHAFDGSLRNFVDAPAPVAWVGLDLGEGVGAVITGVKYCPRYGSGGRMTGGKFQGSDTPDFSSGVVDLFSITSAPWNEWLTPQSIGSVPPYPSFRYVRYLGPDNSFCNVAELQFIGNATGVSAPPAPGGLAAAVNGRNVDLSWGAVSGATEYRIKRATASGGPYLLLSGGPRTNHSDGDLGAGTYYYVVTAMNSAGESIDSAEQSIQVLENIAPGSTTSAHAGSGGSAEGSDKAIDGNVNTKWYTGGNTGSAGWLQIDLGAGNARTVIRYDLTSANDVPARDPENWELLASNDAVNWITLDTRTGETFATRFLTRQYAFTDGDAYRYYRLNILSNLGGNTMDGIQLAEWALISAGTEPPPPSDTASPAAPAGLVATAGETAVTLDWADNIEPDIARYTVYRSATTSGPYSAIASGLTVSTLTDTGLTNGSSYYYVVTAADTSLNQSGHSAEVSATPQATIPEIPTGLSARAGDSSVLLDWADNGEPDLAGYKVYRSVTSGGGYTPVASGVTTSAYTDTTANNGTRYYYVVTAADLFSSESAYSMQVSAIPRSPAAITLTNPGFESPAAGKIPNGFDGSPDVPGWSSGAMQDSGVEAVSPGSGAYRAYAKGGDGAIWQTTTHAIVGGEQFSLSFDLMMSGGAGAATLRASLLAWDGSTERILGSQTFTGGGSWKRETLVATVSDPSPGGQFLRVKVENVGGGGSWLGLDDVALTASDATPPAAPTALVAAAGDGSVDLEWAGNGGSDPVSFTVYRSAISGGGYAPVASGLTTPSYTDTGVVNGTIYHYVVTDSDESANESAASNEVSVAPLSPEQAWRLEHFGTIENTGNAGSNADPDGDGWINAHEFAAGTGPNDRTSLLKVTAFSSDGGDVTLSFLTVTGKSYRVEKSDTLSEGSWLVVEAPVYGTGGVVEITDEGGGSMARWFYRIAVLP